MTNIDVGVWAASMNVFEAVMIQFGLGTRENTVFVPHPHLRITGGGNSGWGGKLVDQTGTDGQGLPIYTARPGIYFNCRALDITDDPLRKSLARNLRHRVNQDLSETKYEQFEADGVTRKPLLERTRLKDQALGAAGEYKITLGVAFDAKMPRRLELYNNGNLIFAAYSLEDGDIATPANTWA